MYTTLRFDVDFDNAVLFAHYVMVVMDGKFSGGGLLEGYDQHHVWMNGKQYARAQSSFIQMPPPEMMIDYPTRPNNNA